MSTLLSHKQVMSRLEFDTINNDALYSYRRLADIASHALTQNYPGLREGSIRWEVTYWRNVRMPRRFGSKPRRRTSLEVKDRHGDWEWLECVASAIVPDGAAPLIQERVHG